MISTAPTGVWVERDIGIAAQGGSLVRTGFTGSSPPSRFLTSFIEFLKCL